MESGPKVHIFGSDLDESAIAVARQARYSPLSVESLQPDVIHTYFKKERECFRANQTIRDMVVFARHDLTREPPFSRMDLISCRNLLIYFTPKMRKNLFTTFHNSLVPGGLMLLGKSESVTHSKDLFSTLDRKIKLYRRRNTVRYQLPPMPRKGISVGMRQV